MKAVAVRNLNYRGFSLFELVIIISIISILTLTGSLTYIRLKTKAFDTRALSDLHSLLTAQENYYIDNESFSSQPDELINLNHGSKAEITLNSSNNYNWSARVYHPQGSKTYCYQYNSKNSILEIAEVAADCLDENVIKKARRIN